MGRKLNSVVTWYKADKGKKFYKRRWFFTLLFLIVIGGMNNNTTTTKTVTVSKHKAPQYTSFSKAKQESEAISTKKIADAKANTNKLNTGILYYTQIKAKDLLADRLTKTELTDGSLIIHFKLTDSISMKDVGDGAFMDASRIFALYKGKTGYKDVTCIGSYPMQDKYGKQSDSNIFAITLDKATIQKIVFDNIDPTTGLLPLSTSHLIRHELTD